MSNKKALSIFIAGSLALSISTAVARPITNSAEQPLEVKPVESAPTDLCKSVISREEVTKALQTGIEPEQISEVYTACYPPVEPVFNEGKDRGEIAKAASEPQNELNFVIPQKWNTHYEEITGCGYHPQRRELACVVKLNQPYGYGGPPPYPANPGSFEWVKFCVFYNTFPIGWESVNTSAVHVHDKSFAMSPPYHYSVAIQANPRLHQALVNGQTLWAGATLSWGFPPPAVPWCSPGYWGNSTYFKIKLDP